MVEGFRIKAVTIEGFKGFMKPKEIDLDGDHIFLLGKNGNGKSSIVEAIRWGLFGSARRPNEIVANWDYSGRCRVEIRLLKEGKLWNLRRTLIRGASGGSDPVLTDEEGKVHPVGEIMPQLDSVDAGEGMHIIFAAQSSPLRRQPEDLTSFERTVFNHLGLSHPRALLSQVDNFLVGQETIEDSLGEKITIARKELDDQIATFTQRRSNLLNSPPWDSVHPPTVAASQNKARQLISEITLAPPDESLGGASLDALIDSAQTALTGKSNQGQDGLQSALAGIQERIDRFDVFLGLQEEIETKESEFRDARLQLSETLGDMSVEGIRSAAEEARSDADTAQLRRQVVEITISLLDRNQDESVPCPICETVHPRQDLESSLRDSADELSENSTSTLLQLESSLKQAEELEAEKSRIASDLEALKQRASDVKKSLGPEDVKELSESSTMAEVEALREQLLESKSSINSQIEDQETWTNEKQIRLAKLRDEDRFHQIQRALVRLNQSKGRLGRVEEAYQDLVSFGESVRTIREALGTSLTERLEKDVPRLSENLSRVFASLTEHPRFDRLTIAKSSLPRLELRVASSHDTSDREYPIGILNGQCESALALVPHFAFSQASDAPTEVYLVLMDDPTRAYDEEHIAILVERLSELGRNVQLVVGSQETARFQELLPQHFDPSSYLIVEPIGWSYQDGPELKVYR